MRRIRLPSAAWFALAVLVLGSFGAGWGISLAVPRTSDDEFNFARWELTHVPGKWLYLTARLFTGGLSPAEEDERLGRFLLLTAEVNRLGRDMAGGGDLDGAARKALADDLAAMRRDRDSLENDVEAIIEGRLTSILRDAGLESSFPLFPAFDWVFPPVDVEFDEPLRVLSTSRRDRIELIERRPLRQDLDLEQVHRIEQDVESDGELSALAERVAGAATYPSIVSPRSDYEALVDVIAHEWVHGYLFFKPLGQRFFSSVQLQTLNETVANLAGKDLAALLVERYPLPARTAVLLEPSAGEPAVDVGEALRNLRLEVEELLGEGEVGAAEALMEERRRELEEEGVVFRRINQAFFASRSLYADAASSIDPLGGKLELLRTRSGDVGEFLRAAAGLTNAGDLDRLLEGG